MIYHLRFVGRVLGRVVQLVSVRVSPLCLLTHMVVSHEVSLNGVNIWFVLH